MNLQELEKRNKILERRWKIMLVLAIVFLVTRPLALYIVNNFIDEARNNAVNNKYSLIDPARQFIAQENYITNIQPLRDYLDEIGKQYPDRVSIYYEQLNSGANIVVNKDLHLFPASLSKLVLGMIVAKKIEEGTWAWDKKFQVEDKDLSSDSGKLYKTAKGQSIAVEKLVEELLVNSDNTAQNILLRNVKIPEDYLGLQRETGLEDLYNVQGHISAKEYSRLFRILYTSSYLEREYSYKILEYLSDATFHDYLSQGIPGNVPFAHKYGENRALLIFADSGIVYVEGKPYMITVILQGQGDGDSAHTWAKNLMKEISSKAYEVSK